MTSTTTTRTYRYGTVPRVYAPYEYEYPYGCLLRIAGVPYGVQLAVACTVARTPPTTVVATYGYS
eukprot:scaffold277363_cov15-Prasinocladus_malaysianus.AAC.1